MTEARRQKSDDLLHVQSIPQKNRAEHADLSSVFCPLFSVIWILKPEVGGPLCPPDSLHREPQNTVGTVADPT
jgi:hypothetical protein